MLVTAWKRLTPKPIQHGGEKKGQGNAGRLEHQVLQQFDGELGVHGGVQEPKLWMSERMTRAQPSASTKSRIFRGKAMVMGGIIIMPMLIEDHGDDEVDQDEGHQERKPI